MSSGLTLERSVDTLVPVVPQEPPTSILRDAEGSNLSAAGYDRNIVPHSNHVSASITAQQTWATVPLRDRLRVLRAARHALALHAEDLADAISPALQRSRADTLVAEVLPLLDACKFLEREATRLLRPRKLSRKGRPFWLTGVQAEVHRVPLGRVLIIAPGNFPLFLAGVQALQALVAGNAVLWKPGVGGERVARLFAATLEQAGLPPGALQVTGEGVEFATAAIASAPDKVIFTGSSATGRQVLEQLAPQLTPAILELSGVDAVLVLESADPHRVAKAIAFGLRLNGGAVCMSPRRVLGTARTLQVLAPLLAAELKQLPAVPLEPSAARSLHAALASAVGEGARVERVLASNEQRPLLLHQARSSMQITREACFAPLLALIEAPSDDDLARVHNDSPYGLTASVFGNEAHARALAADLRVGSVLINDLIAPTADPRLPFGGRGESGYGVTRGAEGLLEMTAVKVVQTRTNRSTRHYETVTDKDVPLFAALIRAAHAGSWAERLRALATIPAAARTRGKQQGAGTRPSQ